MSKKKILDQMETERRIEMVNAWLDVLSDIIDGSPIEVALEKFLLEKDTIEFKTLTYQQSERRINFVEIDVSKWIRMGREIPEDLFQAYAIIAHSNTEKKSNETAVSYHKKIQRDVAKKRLRIQLLEKEVPVLERNVEGKESEFNQKFENFNAFRRLTQSGEFNQLQEEKRIFDNEEKLIYLEKSNELALSYDELENLERQEQVAKSRITKILEERQDSLDLWFTPLGLQTPEKVLPLIRVDKGKYWRGSYDKSEERPILKLQLLQDLFVLQVPVTQALYAMVMHVNPSFRKNLLRPVEKVTWLDAVLFCNNLSRILGRKEVYTYSMNGENINMQSIQQDRHCNGFRLLTEFEWEASARGRDSSIYSGGDDAKKVAWTSENSMNKTQTVRRLHPNSIGLYDMSGNVYEWCWDWYDPEAYHRYQDADCLGPPRGSKKVIRGGSVSSSTEYARVSARQGIPITTRDSFVGFRICCNTL
jgi:formylglycine-generating enzyme